MAAKYAPTPEAQVPFVIEQNNATGAVSYWRGGGQQSEADADGISLADYIHALYGLIRQSQARRVLMIGCGGGTLATMLVRAGVDVTVVDIDASAFEIARNYFALPDAVTCHIADGAKFLKTNETRYDAIVLDAYFGRLIPPHLVMPEFFRMVKSRLARGGIFLINLIVPDDADPWPHDIGSLLQGVWRDVRLLDRPGWIERNAILAAGSVRGLKRPHLLLKPRRRAKQIAAALKTLKFCPVYDRKP